MKSDASPVATVILSDSVVLHFCQTHDYLSLSEACALELEISDRIFGIKSSAPKPQNKK